MGSGGKRVTTRPPYLPAARSRSTRSRMKFLAGREEVVSVVSAIGGTAGILGFGIGHGPGTGRERG